MRARSKLEARLLQFETSERISLVTYGDRINPWFFDSWLPRVTEQKGRMLEHDATQMLTR